MSIEFFCNCGQPLKAREEMIGGKARCPVCKRILTVPRTSEQAAVESDPPPLIHPPASPPASPPAEQYAGPTIRTICPHCRFEVSVPADRPGESVRCSRCGGEFLAPAQAPTWPGGYAASPMQQPNTWYRPPEIAQGSVAALVCGIIAVVMACFGLAAGVLACVGFALSMIAVGQGNGARQRAERTPYLTGGMGTAGMILGIIGLVLHLLVFVMGLAIRGRPW